MRQTCGRVRSPSLGLLPEEARSLIAQVLGRIVLGGEQEEESVDFLVEEELVADSEGEWSSFEESVGSVGLLVEEEFFVDSEGGEGSF